MSSRLAQTIKKLRQERGLNLGGLAQLIGVSQSQVSRYEADKAKPGYLVLKKLFGLANEGSEDQSLLADEMQSIEGIFAPHMTALLDEQVRAIEAVTRRSIDKIAGFQIEIDQLQAHGGPDEQFMKVLRFWNRSRENPEAQKVFTEAVTHLEIYAEQSRNAEMQKFEDLSEKEVEQLEDVLYLIRRGDPSEVRDLIRRASSFRRQTEESERKQTTGVKGQRHGRR